MRQFSRIPGNLRHGFNIKHYFEGYFVYRNKFIKLNLQDSSLKGKAKSKTHLKECIETADKLIIGKNSLE